jgi:hypothetical protein
VIVFRRYLWQRLQDHLMLTTVHALTPQHLQMTRIALNRRQSPETTTDQLPS